MRIMRNIWSSLLRSEVGSSDLLAGKGNICLKKNNRRSAIADNGAEAWGMKTKTSVVLTLLAASLWMCSSSPAASELLFSQNADGQSTYGPSQLWSASGVNSEIADDFNVVANIDRVYASGFIWGAVNLQGVYVRFYQYGDDNKPGALQREYFFAAGDPNVTFDQLSGAIDTTLSPAFAATGRHFLSVQPVINYWYWWSANINAPQGQPFYFRDNAAGEAWHHGDNLNLNVNADVSFYLYGAVTGAGVIDSLSANTLPRSGFLEIFGSNFGGDGTVFIGGIRAPVADWSSTRIVAYVPESAPLATLAVKVVTAAGGSNTKSLAVTTRPAAASHVNWRFRMNGPYSEVRAAVGPDKTVYAIDAFFHLYALAPDGGLKWLVRGAGDKGVAVGPDGIIYVASESFINAFNPNGSAKWSFVQNPRAMICLGVSVGPDGNIYSVGTEGPGVFSLTPAGTLRWHLPESYARPIVDYGEIVFGPNGSSQQLYFYANNHLRAVRLDGTPVFANSSGLVSQLKPGLQPVVGPDGSVHTVLSAYTPNGIPLWSFPTPYPYNVFTPADIGSDGVHYFVQNLSQIFALNPNGSQRWHVTSTSYLAGPIVDSLNTQLVMGSADTGDHAGFILSASAKDGHELWRVTLPAEDPTVFNSALGIFGFNQFVSARARFTADGQTAYVMTATATGDNNTSRSFVYSLNANNGISPTPTPTPLPTTALRSASINLSGTLMKNNQVSVNGIVAVKDASGAAVPGATVAATWIKPNGTTQSQTASSNTTGGSNFITKGGRGTYTLRVNNITKTGYTFDKASSVLTKSITK
jgi:IPT/TIG domain-containing protein